MQATTEWAAQARQLAGSTPGSSAWVSALAAAVRAAEDSDLGTLVVARAVLAKVAAENQTQVDRERSEARAQSEQARASAERAARARAEASRRADLSTQRALDWWVIGCVIGLGMTVLVPWLVGRFLSRDTALLPAGTTAPPIVRSYLRQELGDYFRADYLTGLSVLSVIAAALLLIRPWRGRLAAILAGLVLLPMSWYFHTAAVARWSLEEAKVEASRIFPMPESATGGKYLTCGMSNVFERDGAKYYTWSAEIKGTDECNRIEVYRDWNRIAVVDFDNTKYTSPADRHATRIGIGFGSPESSGGGGVGSICDPQVASKELLWHATYGASAKEKLVYYFAVGEAPKVKSLTPKKFAAKFAKCGS